MGHTVEVMGGDANAIEWSSGHRKDILRMKAVGEWSTGDLDVVMFLDYGQLGELLTHLLTIEDVVDAASELLQSHDLIAYTGNEDSQSKVDGARRLLAELQGLDTQGRLSGKAGS